MQQLSRASVATGQFHAPAGVLCLKENIYAKVPPTPGSNWKS